MQLRFAIPLLMREKLDELLYYYTYIPELSCG